MAPEATQRAAFEEHGSANPGAVMYGKALDIENGTGHKKNGNSQLTLVRP
jgi:hypothetical protein